jgi:HTH-type transcriptional regulator/antitoxin HigA
MAAASRRSLPDTYFELVKEFPLTHIRDDDHLDEAREMIDRLLRKDLDKGAQEYLDALTDLVEIYEEEHVEIPDASEADVLRELMRGNGLSQTKLSKAVGISQSTISAVLGGTRSLTKDQVSKLAQFFHVSPAAFLPVRGRTNGIRHAPASPPMTERGSRPARSTTPAGRGCVSVSGSSLSSGRR